MGSKAILFLVDFIICGVVVVLTYPSIRSCFLGRCEGDFDKFAVTYFSDIKIQITAFFNMIVLIGSKFYFISVIKWFDWSRDHKRATPANYTVIAHDIDKDMTEDDIKDFFREKKLRVEKINFIYNIIEVHKIIKNWVGFERKMLILKMKGREDSQRYKSLKYHRKNVKKRFYEIQEECINERLLSKRFIGKAFVTFKFPAEARRALKVFRKTRINCGKIKISYTDQRRKRRKTKTVKKKLYATTAAEPTDILWENYGLSQANRFFRRLGSALISLLIIAFSLYTIIAIKRLQINFKPIESQSFDLLISACIAVVLAMINFLIRHIMRLLAVWERHTTYTQFNVSVVYRTGLAYFVNSGIVIILANYLLFKDKVHSKETLIWGSKGIVTNVLTIQLLQVIMGPLSILFDPSHIFNKLKRWWFKRKIKNNKNNTILQYEVNQTFEGIDFSIAERYFTIFKLISVALFFQSIMPYLLLLAVLEVGITYWIVKFTLIKRCKRPKEIAFVFSLRMAELIDLAAFLYAAGHLIFEYLVTDRVSVFSLFLLSLGFLGWIITEVSFFTKCFKRRSHTKEKVFEKVFLKFPTDYDRLNPVTQKASMEEWLKNLEEEELKKNEERKIKNNQIKNKILFMKDNNENEVSVEKEENVRLVRNTSIDIFNNISNYIQRGDVGSKTNIDLEGIINNNIYLSKNSLGRDRLVSFNNFGTVNTYKIIDNVDFQVRNSISKNKLDSEKIGRLTRTELDIHKESDDNFKMAEIYGIMFNGQQQTRFNKTDQLHNRGFGGMERIEENEVSIYLSDEDNIRENDIINIDGMEESFQKSNESDAEQDDKSGYIGSNEEVIKMLNTNAKRDFHKEKEEDE